MGGMLYLVGTPIGNLNDISPRAAETLAAVDFIAAEDTRVSLKILNHLGIKKPLVSYYEHNRAASGEKILARLTSGESCALVTDAGMPAVSDPGEDLVALCAEAGVPVTVIPGPCAAVCALAASGLPSGRFTFEGFLSTAPKSRREHLSEIKGERRTMIFLEAPHKLLRTLNDMLAALGDRRIVLAREMTKLHEEFIRTTFSGAIAMYSDTPPRGEYVLVIEGAAETSDSELTLPEALQLVEKYRQSGVSLKDAAKRASEETGISKKTLYDASLRAERE